jgi:ABC-type Zn2+ transport system substrate-binding protein/surface adhesin
MTEDDVRKLLRARIEKAGGLRAFGAEHEIDPAYVGRVDKGAKLTTAILDALGLEVASTETLYRRKRRNV